MSYRYTIAVLLCLLSRAVILHAQDNNDENSKYQLNQLQAPSSPGANLIGTAPSQIQTFTNPSAFMVAIQNGVANINGFPSSYAVDIAPAWLFTGDKITMNKYQSNKLDKNIWQSLVLSLAYNSTNNTIKQTDLGLGFKMSLLRGHVNDRALNMIHESDKALMVVLAPVADAMATALKNDETMKQLDKQQQKLLESNASQNMLNDIVQQINDRQAFIQDSVKNVYLKVNAKYGSVKSAFDSLKKITEQIDFKRQGFKLDLAGGVALNFPGQIFNYSLMKKAGAWLTAGYEWKNNLSVLGIVRYMHNPNQVYYNKDSSLLSLSDLDIADGGLRLEYQGMDGKFLFGGEIIYRAVLNPQNVNPAWRYVINCDYEVQKNRHLTLTLGRDFDGTFNKNGNLVAALNFIVGLGNEVRSDAVN